MTIRLRFGAFFRVFSVLICAFAAASCTSLRPDAAPPGPAPVIETPRTDTPLAIAFNAAAQQHPQTSGFRLVSAGIDGLALRIELIDAAEQSLDLQYYIFHFDQSGRLIQSALLRAADRGVHIRIILDDGETLAGDEKLAMLAVHPNIQVRVFNPFRYRGHLKLLRAAEFMSRKSTLDYRMHNKLLVVDGVVAMTGGRNIGDQYFQIDPDSQFGDDDVAVVGDAVPRLSKEFLDYWNHPIVVSVDRLHHRKWTAAAFAEYRAEVDRPFDTRNAYWSNFQKRLAGQEPLTSTRTDPSVLTWSGATVLYDSPDKKMAREGKSVGRLMYGPVAERIASANAELLMVTPYFVPVPDEIRLLSTQRDRNVHVRILTNSLPAAPDVVAHAGYMRHRQELLADGVHLYEIRALLGSTRGSGENKAVASAGNYALHAKLLVFDRRSLFVGSMNLDHRSVRLNTEMGLIIDSPSLAQTIVTRFDLLTQPKNAYEVSLVPATQGRGPQLVWKTEENGSTVEYHDEPARSSWQRFKARLFTHVPLDEEL